MENKALQGFFNGAFDLLKASFAASKMLSSSAKGASREHAARELLRSLIPPVARIESGDVVDVHGNQSGQLDAVVVDHRSPTLKLEASETSLILAEGALAVLEIKSDLARQKAEVVRTFRKIEPLRPVVAPVEKFIKENKEKYAYLHRRELKRREDHQSIPFIVVAGTGWTKHARLALLGEELRGLLPEKRHLELLLVTLDPPAFAVCEGWTVRSTEVDEAERGDIVAAVWFTLVNHARLHSAQKTLRTLPLARYFQGVPGGGRGPEQSGAVPQSSAENGSGPRKRDGL